MKVNGFRYSMKSSIKFTEKLTCAETDVKSHDTEVPLLQCEVSDYQSTIAGGQLFSENLGPLNVSHITNEAGAGIVLDHWYSAGYLLDLSSQSYLQSVFEDSLEKKIESLLLRYMKLSKQFKEIVHGMKHCWQHENKSNIAYMIPNRSIFGIHYYQFHLDLVVH